MYHLIQHPINKYNITQQPLTNTIDVIWQLLSGFEHLKRKRTLFT